MNVSRLRRRPRRPRLPLAAFAALLVVAALPACKKDEAAARPGAAAPAPAHALDATLVLRPVDAQGRRAAVAQIQILRPVASVDLGIEVPDGCRIVAGAQRRQFQKLAAGEDLQSFVQLECTEAASGDVRLVISGQEEDGTAIAQQLTAGL